MAENPFARFAEDTPASTPSETSKPEGQNPFQQFASDGDDPFVAPQTSGVGAFASHAALGAAPAYAGWVGAGAGAELGAGIGGLAGPIGAGVGGLAGGLAGFFGGAKLGETAQDYALDAAPDSWKEKIGLDEHTRQLQEQQHPYASFIGGMAPYALTMRPGGFSRSALPENSTALQRLMANPTIARAIGGVAMGGVELAQEGGLTGHEPDWTKVAIATGFGTIFNKPTRFGEALSGLGSQAMRGTVLRPPTLIEADENKIIGPGNTEAVFQGSQDKDPEAALTALKNAQAERLATGQPPLPPPDANQLVAQMHPELFNAYDDLVRRKKTFQEWEGAAQEGPEKNAAQMHLRTTQNELDELYPQVRAAYRRANDHLGSETVAAAPVPGGQPIIDNEHDVVSGAVANKNENIVYIDKRIPQSVPELLDKDGNEADLHKYLAIHEQAEKQAMAQGMGYDEAHHNVATPAEKAAVQADGVSWSKYSEVIDGFLKDIEKEKPTNAPPNPHVDPEAAVHDKAGAPESVPQAPTQPAQPNASEQHRTAIVNDVTQKLIAAKRPAEEAEAAARLVASYYETRAARFNGALGSAHDLYIAEAPEIKAGRAAKNTKEFAQKILGKIRLEEGKRSIITLARNANAATFIHESGHQWLEDLIKDAQHEAAPEDLKADESTVRDWLGGFEGQPLEEQHEQFAKGFEQYMREGVAPSPGLAGVFAKFRNWLLNIYETIKGLGKPISEDIRGVFDRMLSTAPERTVIAPERGGGPSLADIHKADADLTDPADADKIADRMAAERARYINEPPPEIEHEVAATATVTGDVPATEAGEGGSGRQDLGGEGSTARPLAPGSSVGEGRGEDGASGGGASAKGAGSSSRASTGSESNRARPDAGGQPLAPAPKPALGSGESRILDKAGNIRVENLTNSQDVAQAIHDSADRNADFADARGAMTKGQMSDLADAMGLRHDPEDTFGLNKLTEEHLSRLLGGVDNLAPKILAARRLVVQSAGAVSDLAKAAALSGSDADAMALGVAISRHDMIQSALAGVTAEWGRAGNAFHNLMSGWEKAQDLNQFLKENTGRDLFQLKLMAKYFQKMDKPEQVSNGVRDSGQRNYGKMLIEYVINNFISGIPAHLTYVAANGITLAEKVLITPLVGHALTGGNVMHAGEVGAGLQAIREAFPSAVLATKQAFMEGRSPLLPGATVKGQGITTGVQDNLAGTSHVNLNAQYADLVPNVFGMIRGLLDGIKAFGSFVPDAPLLGVQHSSQGFIPDITVKGAPVLPIGTLWRMPSRMVASMHTFMNVLNYAVEMNQSTLRQAMNEGHTGQALINRVGELRGNPSQEKMAEYAKTANNLSLMGQNGALLQKVSLLVNHEFNFVPGAGPTPWLRLIDPFIQIGGQISRQGPGRFGLFAPEIRADLMGKNGAEAQAIAQSRALSGGALAMTFAGLAAYGYASGSGPTHDPKQMAAWRRMGNQPYSLRVGDIWYPLHKLGGLGLIAGLSAQMHDVAKVATDGELLQASSMVWEALKNNYFDESFLRGPSDLIKAFDDHERYGSRYISDWVSNLLTYSSGQAAFARMIDPYVRRHRGILETLQAKIPYVSEGLQPLRDVWGQPIKNLPGLGYGATALYESHVNNDPTEKALYGLGVYPGPVSPHIRNVKLTEQEYDDYARIAGKIAKDRMDAIVNSPDWQTWPAHVRHDFLESNLKLSRETGANLVMQKYPHIAADAYHAKQGIKPQ